MDKRKLNWITMAFVVLTVLMVGLMVSHTLRRSSHIVLPDETPSAGEVTEEGDGQLSVVEITPDTVQTAIAALERPEHYRRTVTIRQFWPGGSAAYELTTAVRGGLTRTDRRFPDGQVRHSITDGKTVRIWYAGQVLTLPAGDIGPDQEQGIPTYENVLKLDKIQIAAADFRDLSGLRCIYVETTADTGGYVQRFWISVDTGLLVSAEKLRHEELIYSMTALTLDSSLPPDSLFMLPDGTSLFTA